MKVSSSSFPGYPAAGIQFLRDLKKNNHREWFMPRVETYRELVRGPMVDLVRSLHIAMLQFAPEYVGDDPAKSVYRVYRDVRFSRDKTPYKTNASALFWHTGLEKNQGAGFYVSVSPEEVGIGGGLYMASPVELLAVRQRIADAGDEFRSLVEAKTLRRLMGELKGERLTRVPKGFSAEDRAAELLKLKQFFFYETLNPAIATTPKLQREILSRFEAMTPFARFLDGALVRSARKNGARKARSGKQ